MKTLLTVLVLVALAAPASAALTTQHIATDADLVGLLSDTLFVGEGRIGDNLTNGDFEVDLGGDTSAPATQANYVWANGTPVPWSLVYNHMTNQVTFTVDTVVLQWVSPLSGYTDVFVRTRAVNAATDIVVGNLVLDGENVGDASSADGDASGLDILWISGGTLADGFTLTGTATLSWGATMPLHSRLAFQVKIGTVSTVPVEDTTWGGIKALYSE